LISEGLPGYFGNHGHVETVQPNYGLDELFGARQNDVEFMPDISDDMKLQVKGLEIFGRYFRQEYELHGGAKAGQYPDGKIAAVENRLGNGRTLLIGTFPGAGYFLHHSPATKNLFAGFLDIAGIKPAITINDHNVQARLHQGKGGAYLWVTNPSRESRTVTIEISQERGTYTKGNDLWGSRDVTAEGGKLSMTIPERDAVVVALS
jgi:beta-galactosidase